MLNSNTLKTVPLATLVDSNIIIYSARPDKQPLRQVLLEYDICVSALSYQEVMNHPLKRSTKKYYAGFFSAVKVLALTDTVTRKANDLRKEYNMQPADAIIAATAIINDLTLTTANIKDFRKVKELTINKTINV